MRWNNKWCWVLFWVFFSVETFGQTLGINYQGIARNDDGTALSDQNISLRIEIYYSSMNGTLAYRESHSVVTNQFGLFSIVIGEGTAEVNSFSDIDWSNKVIWMTVSMDTGGGTNFEMIGSQQLQAVPFAKYAENVDLQAGAGIQVDGNLITNTLPDKTVTLAGAGTTTVSGTYPNFLITGNAQDLLISNDALSITGNPGATSIDLTPYKQNLSLSDSGNVYTLSISAGNTIQFDISDYDNDSTNEIQDLSIVPTTGTTREVAISGSNSVQFDIADNDNDSTNEIQDLSIVPATGTTREVAISGSNSVQFDVADNDNDAANEIQDLQNVLTQGNDAGTNSITNLSDPSGSSDAATKNYVDAGDADYAFKANINFTTSGSSGEKITFNSLEINQSSVVASSTFTAPVDGVYVFVLQLTPSNLLDILARKTSGASSVDFTFQAFPYSAGVVIYYGSTIWSLNAGDTVELINDSGSDSITGIFFGYKL